MSVSKFVWSLPLWVSGHPFVPSDRFLRGTLTIPSWGISLPLGERSQAPGKAAGITEALARTPYAYTTSVRFDTQDCTVIEDALVLPPWSYKSDSPLSLGALCTPDDPSISDFVSPLVGKRNQELTRLERVEEVYKSLCEKDFSHLCSPRPKPVDEDSWWQELQPPWLLLRGAKNEATCLDLSLLFCSILEACGEKPILFLNEETGHAWIGIWLDRGQRFRPRLSAWDLASCQGQLASVEVTGVCGGASSLSWREALDKGSQETNLAARATIAIDVCALRPPHGRIVPIRLGHDPIVQRLKWLADQEVQNRRTGFRETLHLILALCDERSPIFVELFTNQERRELKALINSALPNIPTQGLANTTRDSANWSLLWESAHIHARRRGDQVVQEGDVLWALFESPSRNVGELFKTASVNLKVTTDRLSGLWPRAIESTDTRLFKSPQGKGANIE